MALITDPDQLNQGTLNSVADLAFTASSGAVTTLTGATTIPAIAAGEIFEIRSSNTPGNDGLYEETGGSPTTSSVTCTKRDDSPNPVNDSASSTDILGTTGTGSEKSVMIDTSGKGIYLIEQGNLSVDGVTEQALYSFLKKRRKDDALVIKFDFPMVMVTPEQAEFVSAWTPVDVAAANIRTTKVIRTGGWSEIDTSGVLNKQWFGLISLGTFEDPANDKAYLQLGDDPTDTGAAVDVNFAGVVNEAVQTYEDFGNPGATTAFATTSTLTRTTGSFITDGYLIGGQVTTRLAEDSGNNGTFVLTNVETLTLTVTGTPFTTNVDDTTVQLAVDNRNAFRIKSRVRDGDPDGKFFTSQALADIGVTVLDNKAFRFPLSNDTDGNISETDSNIDANTPYTQIVFKIFDGVYSKDVDSSTNRSFGAVIDVGTHSGIDGSTTAAGTVLTSTDGGIPTSTYDSGTLTINGGTDEGDTFNIVSTTATTVTISGGTFTSTDSGISFSLQRSSPVVASTKQIYEKMHRLLRQDADINDLSTGVVVGRTVDDYIRFVGANLETLQFINANSGTTDGVAIEGFDTNDTNNIKQTDNSNVLRSFPTVAAGTVTFNANLVNDTDPEWWMFFQYTHRTTVSDLALSGVSGSTASLDSAGANLPTMAQGDYFALTDMTDSNNNGVWEVTDATPSSTQADVRKYTGETVANEGSASHPLDRNPDKSPGAIIVNDNGGTPIAANITGSSATFDFAYTTNVQGGRAGGVDANVILKAIGLETAKDASATGVISSGTGQSFSLVAELERNFTP